MQGGRPQDRKAALSLCATMPCIVTNSTAATCGPQHHYQRGRPTSATPVALSCGNYKPGWTSILGRCPHPLHISGLWATCEDQSIPMYAISPLLYCWTQYGTVGERMNSALSPCRRPFPCFLHFLPLNSSSVISAWPTL